MSCALCPAGYANPNTGSTSPDACVKCAPGFYNNVAQVATVGAEFGAKPLYAFDGVEKCRGCLPGMYDRVGKSGSPVNRCETCGVDITKTRQARFVQNARTGI